MVNISTIAYAVRTAAQSTPNPIKLSHAQQLVSAALGYKSLAAYQSSLLEVSHLDHAAHFVLDNDLLDDRTSQLGLQNEPREVISLIKNTFISLLPRAKVHESLEHLNNYIFDLVNSQTINDEAVSKEIASTNGDGIREIHLPIDDFEIGSLPLTDNELQIDIHGHISMNIDTERPYSGHKIYIRALLTIERTGKVSIAEPACTIVSANLDYDWGDDRDDVPRISLAEALAAELDLELSEAEELADAEVMSNESNDGLVYGHFFDFSRHASPLVARKLMKKYGSLTVEVPAWFFENVSLASYL